MSCESRVVHMSRLLRAQVLYFKCRCAASAVIIEDFSYMHTIGRPANLYAFCVAGTHFDLKVRRYDLSL